MNNNQRGAKLRATAAEVVDDVVQGGRSLDAALATKETGLPEEDRALLRFLSYGVLRHHWRLMFWVGELLEKPLRSRDRIVNELLAVGLFQLSESRIPDHAVVSQTVEAVRVLRRPRLASLVNAILRRAVRDNVFNKQPATAAATHNHPDWLLAQLRSDWPDDWQDIVAANNAQAPMWLRVNSCRETAASYARRLAEIGIDSQTLASAPHALRLGEPQTVTLLPGFFDGDVSVQDAAAQLAAPWLLQGVTGRVLDACAAPGGKTGHILEIGVPGIDVVAVEKDAPRLSSVTENLARLGQDATLITGDASKTEQWWDKQPFAAILLDAPCSATGVIRRHPDIKHLRRASDIKTLSSLQGELLDALWPTLMPGGRLLYVTCSVLAAENDHVVGRFLERTADAREEQVLQDYNIRDLMRDKACGHQVLPGTAGMDGFYYAGLLKVS